jgi:hypothetical protein
MSFLLVDYITPKHKNSVEQNRQWNLTGGRSKDARDEARQNAHGLNLCRLIVSTEQTMEFNRKQGCKTKKIGRGPAISARTHSISFLFFCLRPHTSWPRTRHGRCGVCELVRQWRNHGRRPNMSVCSVRSCHVFGRGTKSFQFHVYLLAKSCHARIFGIKSNQ